MAVIDMRHSPYGWPARILLFADQQIWLLRYQLFRRLPVVLWRLLARLLWKVAACDHGLQQFQAQSDFDRNVLSGSHDWLRYRWIDRPFRDRYWNLLRHLTSQTLPDLGDFGETLAAWRHLVIDIESLYAFAKSPEPFNHHPIGEVRQLLDGHRLEIYRAVAQMGLRLRAERLCVWTMGRLPLFRHVACRWPADVGSLAVGCVDALDRLRIGFLLVLLD